MKQLDLFEQKPSMFEKCGTIFEAIVENISKTFEPYQEEWDITCGCKTKFTLIYMPVNPRTRYGMENYEEMFYCTNCGRVIIVVNTKIKEIKSDLREARNNG